MGKCCGGLDYDLDEFTFWFNRRTSRYRGKLFYRLLHNAVTIAPAPFAQIAKGVRGRGHRVSACGPAHGREPGPGDGVFLTPRHPGDRG